MSDDRCPTCGCPVIVYTGIDPHREFSYVPLIGSALKRLQEELRIREESQIPIIPRGAQERIQFLEARLDEFKTALTEALERAEDRTALSAGEPSDGNHTGEEVGSQHG